MAKLTDEQKEKIKAKKPKIESQDELSEYMLEIIDGICNTSSLTIECEFCGRVYFGRGGDYDPGEYEELCERAELNPEMYIESDDYIPWGHINGNQYVYKCDCNGPRRVENFIWSHRGIIAKYLQLRARGELEQAQRNMEIVNKIKLKEKSEFETE